MRSKISGRGLKSRRSSPPCLKPGASALGVFGGWLYTVAVSPQYQRQGIGRKLVQQAESALIAMGCPKINLQVRSSNAEVVAFYRRLGYAIEERISMGKVL